MLNKFKALNNDEKGIGTLEILLIVAVLVAVAVVFRKTIIDWVNQLFSQADQEISKIGNDLEQLNDYENAEN